MLRTLGQWMGKIRRMASEFQDQFQEAMREAEMADLKKQVDEMTTIGQSYANFDPLDDVRKEIEGAVDDDADARHGRDAPTTPPRRAADRARCRPPPPCASAAAPQPKPLERRADEPAAPSRRRTARAEPAEPARTSEGGMSHEKTSRPPRRR